MQRRQGLWIFFGIRLSTSTDLDIFKMNSGLVNSLKIQISWYFPIYLTLPLSLYTFQRFDFSQDPLDQFRQYKLQISIKKGKCIFKHRRLFVLFGDWNFDTFRAYLKIIFRRKKSLPSYQCLTKFSKLISSVKLNGYLSTHVKFIFMFQGLLKSRLFHLLEFFVLIVTADTWCQISFRHCLDFTESCCNVNQLLN